MARSDKVKREIYTRELGGRHIQIYIIQKSDDTRTEKGCVDSDSLLLRNFRRFDGRYIESWAAPAEYGRRNCKRVTVGAISIVRIPNVHRTSQINSAPGKMYAQLWPWHTKGEFKRLLVNGPPGVVCRQWPLKENVCLKTFFWQSPVCDEFKSVRNLGAMQKTFWESLLDNNESNTIKKRSPSVYRLLFSCFGAESLIQLPLEYVRFVHTWSRSFFGELLKNCALL